MRNLENSRPTIRIIVIASCLAAIALAGAAVAADAGVQQSVTSGAESRSAVVAEGIAQITGLAISPLLVLVGLGWYDFAQLGGSAATVALPLHANPWLLMPCTAVLALALSKKILAPAIPLPIRKVLDAAEYLEAKLSALVAAGVLLPTIIATMAAATEPDPSTGAQIAGLSAMLGGASSEAWILYALLVPAAIAIFLSVWISFHVIDALIVLSPFAIVDTILVALRGSVLGILALAFFISPFVALALCLPLIGLSFLFAGWCVRLDLFALCVATDLLFTREMTAHMPPKPARTFLAARGYGAPIRTMGYVEPVLRGVRFTYRPLFVLPKRTLELDVTHPTLVCGAIWSTLCDGQTTRGVVAFPPRYSSNAKRIADCFSATLRESFLLRKWRGLRGALATILTGPRIADEAHTRTL